MKTCKLLRRVPGWLPVILSLAACAQPPKPNPQENKMSASNVIELPFGIKPKQMAAVEIVYRYQSYKTGAGKQEVHLLGDGQIRLVKTRAYNLPEEIKEGKLQRMYFVRLLEMFEDANFMGMEEEYKSPGGDPYWKRSITLKLDDERTHTVGVTNDHLHVPFEQLAGAIRILTSLGVPEILKKQFFPNL